MWFRSCVLFKKAVCVFTYRLLKNLTSTKTPPFNQRSLPRVSLQQQKVGFTSVGFLKERTIPPNNIGIRTRQERSRHKPTNIMECHKVFCVAHLQPHPFLWKDELLKSQKNMRFFYEPKSPHCFTCFFSTPKKWQTCFFHQQLQGS